MRIPGRLKSPVFFLTLANLFSAAVGFVSGMLVARWVGAEGYGVVGIIAAVNTGVLCLWDVRLNDVMARLYFDKDIPEGSDPVRFRTSIIQSSLLCYGAMALVFLAAGIAANLLLARLFTTAGVKVSWAVASAAAVSLTYLLNPVGYMLRLSGRFRLLGFQAMAGSLLSSGILVLCVWRRNDLDGYYTGILLSNAAGAVLALSVALTVWLRLDRLPLFSALDLSALRHIRKSSRFLFFGNLLNYLKLGHRTADVLLVGYFCDDAMTGVYKLARSLTDKLYMVFDAMNQVYFPSFLRMLAERDLPGYRGLARRIALGTLALTAFFLAAEWVGLPYFTEYILGGKFPGVESVILVLTLPFFFVTGMYIWIWPLVLHHDLAGRYTLFNGLAVLLQHGLGIWAFSEFARLEAFAVGYLGHYVLLMGLAAILVHRRIPEAVPRVGTDRK